MAKRYGVLGTIDLLQVGGVQFVDLDNLLVFHGIFGGNGYSTYRLMNGTAGYQVTALKELHIRAARILVTTNNGLFGYGDTDVGLNSLSAPTNPVYSGGSSTGANFNGSDTNWNTSEFPVFFNVPASKYPFSYTTGGSNVFLFGYEFNA
jgi:hypothetical protein